MVSIPRDLLRNIFHIHTGCVYEHSVSRYISDVLVRFRDIGHAGLTLTHHPMTGTMDHPACRGQLCWILPLGKLQVCFHSVYFCLCFSSICIPRSTSLLFVFHVVPLPFYVYPMLTSLPFQNIQPCTASFYSYGYLISYLSSI